MPKRPVGAVLTTFPGGPITGCSAKETGRLLVRADASAATGVASTARNAAGSPSALFGVTIRLRMTEALNSWRVCSSTIAGVNSGTDCFMIAQTVSGLATVSWMSTACTRSSASRAPGNSARC